MTTVSGTTVSSHVLGCGGFYQAPVEYIYNAVTPTGITYSSGNANVSIQPANSGNPSTFNILASQTVGFSFSGTLTFTDPGSGKTASVPYSVINAPVNPVAQNSGAISNGIDGLLSGSICPNSTNAELVIAPEAMGDALTPPVVSSNDSSTVVVGALGQISGSAYDYPLTIKKAGSTYVMASENGVPEMIPVNIPYTGMGGC